MSPRAPAAAPTPTTTPLFDEDLCGDSIVNPGEQCDLGTRNGREGSGCTIDCRLTGQCEGSGKTCTVATDCGEGKGCWGNGIVEATEQCDDGNHLDGDCCSSRARNESIGDQGMCPDGATACTSDADCGGAPCRRNCQPQTCPGVGPHIRKLEARRTLLTDRDGDGRLDAWRTSGVIDSAHCYADPAAQVVALTLSEVDEILYDGIIEPDDCVEGKTCFRRFGSFTEPVWPPPAFSKDGPACRARWRFLEPAKRIARAPDFGRARLEQTGKREGECSLRFRMRSDRGLSMPTLEGNHLRQTIQIGDNCYSDVLTCTQHAGSRAQVVCVSPLSDVHAAPGLVSPGAPAPHSPATTSPGAGARRAPATTSPGAGAHQAPGLNSPGSGPHVAPGLLAPGSDPPGAGSDPSPVDPDEDFQLDDDEGDE